MRHATIRVRLTVLYGGMFLLAGAILLAVMFLLVRQNLDARLAATDSVSVAIPKTGTAGGTPTIQLSDGRRVTVVDFAKTLTAQKQQVRDSALSAMLTEGGIALLVVGVAAVGFGWLVAERALRPVHGITATARRVAAGASAQRGLHERIALTGPRDEIKELADTFDDMLERLDRSFDGQRRFVANASHELRTPLAINRALVEVAVTRPGAGEDARRLGESLLTVNARHERLIDGLLMLAESEQRVVDQSTVDLAEVAAHVLEQTGTGEVAVRLRELAPAATRGDPVLLERLIQNLVENAVRHNRPGGWLDVETRVVEGAAALAVTNSGPVIAAYELEGMFEPFRRLGGDRIRDRSGGERGFGLGLSIVRAVAHAHGGTVAARPVPGGGLRMTVRLPLAEHRPEERIGSAD